MAKSNATMLMPLIWLFYPTVVLICSAASLNSSTDEMSLLAFKARITSDPDSVLSTNWTRGTAFCTWIGVTCSPRDNRVTVLNLFNMGLEGTVAEEIGNLSFLTHLNISNNTFSGPIPDRIGNLSRLRILRLSNNQLSGQIPWSIGLLTNLETLDLSDNSLTGGIPWSILRLPNLQFIAVTRNYQLSGTLPPDLCHFSTSLQHLRLSVNQFVGSIPESLSRCSDLRTISLSRNNFTGSIPVNIGNLSQLQILALGGNQLSGTIPPSVGNLSSMQILDFSLNTLQGQVPPAMGRLSNLTHLNLGLNNLNGELPQSIFNLSRLRILSLPINNLSGTLPPSIDTQLPNLEELFLGGNLFTGNIPRSISNLSTLTTFDLIHNSFSGHIPVDLGNLERLRVLRLGGNNFTNDLSIPEQDFLTSLSNCKNLTLIRIEENPITGVLPRSVGNLSQDSLQNFIAFSCRIRGTIPDEIGNLNSLIWLTLGGNELTGVIPASLGRLENLQRLSLYRNRLWGTIPHSLCSLTGLFYVSLENNGLSGELPMCLGNLTALQEIYMGQNSFTSNIPSTLWSHPRIQVLSLFSNLFNGSLPPEIGYIRGVTELHLHGNQLFGRIPSSIGQLGNLINVTLSDNKLDGPVPEAFADLRFLQYLDLSQNNLSGQIPTSLERLADLSYFNVSFNELTGEIPDEGRFRNFTAEFFTGNRGLCGSSRLNVQACEIQSHRSSRDTKLVRYIVPPIALIVAGAIIALLLLKHYGRRKPSAPSKSEFPDSLEHERISYYEILRATSNLDVGNLVGKGGIGSVYKATFSDGVIAAVKVFDLDVQGAFKSFDMECQIMRSLRHRNLVKVITSCTNLDFKALVMEYMPNGNLDKWLYSPYCSLNITQRLGIMIDVASAVEYLHRGYLSPIIHCDLKPSNILLDADKVGHVGDFGIAKLLMEDQTSAQTKTLGTIGYMAPEYGSGGLVSTTADVYSFGILLMETFTRKKPTDGIFVGELTMTRWVSESFPSALTRIVDSELLNMDDEKPNSKTGYEGCLAAIMGLALECTSDLPEERLSMNDVLVRLKKINLETISIENAKVQ